MWNLADKETASFDTPPLRQCRALRGAIKMVADAPSSCGSAGQTGSGGESQTGICCGQHILSRRRRLRQKKVQPACRMRRWPLTSTCDAASFLELLVGFLFYFIFKRPEVNVRGVLMGWGHVDQAWLCPSPPPFSSFSLPLQRDSQSLSQVSIDESLRAKVKKPTVSLRGAAWSQGLSG